MKNKNTTLLKTGVLFNLGIYTKTLTYAIIHSHLSSEFQKVRAASNIIGEKCLKHKCLCDVIEELREVHCSPFKNYILPFQPLFNI